MTPAARSAGDEPGSVPRTNLQVVTDENGEQIMNDLDSVLDTAQSVRADGPSTNIGVLSVGFIGIGRMGAGMAANLLKAGHQVTVYNRTPAKAAGLIAQGAKAAASVAEACQGDAVITMLANDEAVEGVAFGDHGIIADLSRAALHVSCSTISVELSQRLAEAHAAKGQRFVAAPVFGRPDVAEAGELFVVAGGEPAALKTAEPLLNAIGQRTFAISDTPSAANLVKLSGNFLGASVIESLGEALTLISKAGIDRHRYLELLTSTLFDAPIYKTYGALIADGRFAPAGFAAPLGQKDIRLVLAAAEDLRVPMPLASLLRDRFLTLLARGGAELDWSAIGQLSAADAGIVGSSMSSHH
jgi:3-hydroxyisobutyrate dehydrogenase-like beta-hydroxyacid dehydrogenase